MSELSNPTQPLDVTKEYFSSVNITASDFDLKRLFSSLDPFSDVTALRYWACRERGVDSKAFDNAHHIWRVLECLGEYPRDVVHFIDLFCARHQVKVAFDNTITATGLIGEPTSATLATDVYLLGQRLHLPMTMRSKEAISEALSAFVRRNQAEQVEEAIKAIITAPSADLDTEGEWLKLAAAFADERHQSHLYTVRALQASIWQVKRKLINDPRYPVTDHLMCVLTGPQGSGKSTFWDKFFSPLQGFVYPADFKQLKDSKNFDLWRHSIVFFDEMAYAQKADIDEVKNAITSTHRTSRLHHSHGAANIRNAATFFGAANGALGSIIFDKTGLRRFAAIATKAAPKPENEGRPVVDWEAMNDIDFALLWQSVDHTAGHPLMCDNDARAEWAELIEGERAQDAAEMFIRQTKFENRRFRLDDLFTLYRDFCQSNNERELSSRAFSRRMKDLEDMADFPFRTGLVKGYATWTPINPAAGGDNVVTLNPNIASLLADIDTREAV